ncbi:hypothetical protein [Croceicoccus bisphenolivorans]|nr:hypothetical protein [Croceicoccus bisphenolivorans]
MNTHRRETEVEQQDEKKRERALPEKKPDERCFQADTFEESAFA